VKISLNGEWFYYADLKHIGEDSGWMEFSWINNHFQDLEKIILPNCWNIIPSLKRFEGSFLENFT